jgi:chromosomal replication initiation ATPase DnaA
VSAPVTRMVQTAAASVWSRPDELMGRSAYRPVCHARFAVWVVLRERGWSTPKIGDAFDRDPSTVRSGLLSARVLMAQPKFAGLVRDLRGVC